ncbi:MAG: hypothetical protein J5I91_08535 [Bacteroidetes bacterium]|nr:hypothetical protein [Bacteroidota bacterium]
MTNKRAFLLLLSIISLFSIDSYSQRGFRAGLVFTPNLSRANLMDPLPADFGRKNAVGLVGGLMAQYGMNEGFALHTGFLLSSRSYTIINYDNPYNEYIRGNMWGFEIPVGFYLRQPINKQSSMRELVGMSVFTNQNKDKVSFYRSETENPFALEAIIDKRISYSLNLGVEFMRTFESGHCFTAGIIYKRGLGTPVILNVINDKDSREPLFQMGYSGTYVGMNFSYLFNFKDLKPIKGELYFD